MNGIDKHLVREDESIKSAMQKLDNLASDAILFVVDGNQKLIGSLTDGDLRRGFLRNLDFNSPILDFIHKNPVTIVKNKYSLHQVEKYKNKNYKIIPILNEVGEIIDILNFRVQKTIIPAHAVIMAGGEGKRLRPLTASTPKPLLKIGDKPIIEYNIDSLLSYGIRNITLSVNYLADQLVSYFGNGEQKNARINYVKESKPLGTVGSVSLISDFYFDDILVANSDILTNINYADFYSVFKEADADMAVAATTYNVDVPYAIMEVDGKNLATSLREKPRYTYYANAGIYFMKRSVLDIIPKDGYYDITTLMETLINSNKKLITYPITGYWLDIGKHEDFKKAQEDIKYLSF